MNKIRKYIESFGWPRLVIALFLFSLFVIAPFVNIRISTSLSDIFVRFGMNAVMVLAMVPMVLSGTGLNFGLPLGIIAGLIGAVTSIEIGTTGFLGFLTAILISLPFAIVLGLGYGVLLNKVKGGEMMVATYVGFSSVAFMSMMWLILPYKSADMIWAYGGSGLRTTISVEKYWFHVLNDFLAIKIGDHFVFPTGSILFFAFMAFLVWLFFKTKIGAAIIAVGSNPEFARASGINIDKMRIISVIMSTVLGAIGIIVYEQSFGFIQLYMGPFYMAFPAVAAILIGGATVHRATITNVIIGTLLFQGILTMTPSVINNLIKTDMSEAIRIVVSNGMILYALTRKKART